MPKIFAFMLLLTYSLRAFAADESAVLGAKKSSVIRDESGVYRVCGHGTIEELEVYEDPDIGMTMSVRMQYMNLLNDAWPQIYDGRKAKVTPSTKQQARITIYSSSGEDKEYFQEKYSALRTAFLLNAPARLAVDWLDFSSCSEPARDFQVRVCGQQGLCLK